MSNSSQGDALEVVHPKQHPLCPPGFYAIPNYPDYAISEAGMVVHARTGTQMRIEVNSKSFWVVTLRDPYKNYSFEKPSQAYLDRLLARTFVGRPQRHLNKSHDALRVEHLDGSLVNNALNNLAWMTSLECKKRAVARGDSGHGPVRAYHRHTNQTMLYGSRHEVAQRYGFPSEHTHYFLEPGRAGFVPLDGWVFRYEDRNATRPWPGPWDTPPEIAQEQRFAHQEGWWLLEELNKRYVPLLLPTSALKAKMMAHYLNYWRFETEAHFWVTRKLPFENWRISYAPTQEALVGSDFP